MIRGGGGGEKVVKSGRVIHAGVIKRVISRHAPRNPRNRLNDPPSSIPLVISRFIRDAEFAGRAIFRLFRNEKTNFFERPHDEKNGESSFQISLSTSFAARIDRARFLRPSEKRS